MKKILWKHGKRITKGLLTGIMIFFLFSNTAAAEDETLYVGEPESETVYTDLIAAEQQAAEDEILYTGEAESEAAYTDAITFEQQAAEDEILYISEAESEAAYTDATAFEQSEAAAEEKYYGWLMHPEGWYFYNDQGVKTSGWLYDAGAWYFLNGADAQYPGLMVSGCKWMVDGIEYYFDGSGAMQTGWINDEGWYYYYDSGYKATGWLYDAGAWYYLDPENNGKMSGDAWRLIDGIWYFLYANGKMAENCWLYLGGNWYYFDGSGAMLSGWQYIKDFWYYMYQPEDAHVGPYGAMAAGTVIDGCYIDADGKWTPPHLKQMNYWAQEYASATDYLILVDTSANKVGIYTGSSYNWTNIIYWDCSCGAPESPTVKGIFTIGIRGDYFDSGEDRCFWYTQFYGDYLFHSTTYNRDGSVRDPRLGMNVSHGCVRLDITNAKWIYDTIPYNTTVVVW